MFKGLFYTEKFKLTPYMTISVNSKLVRRLCTLYRYLDAEYLWYEIKNTFQLGTLGKDCPKINSPVLSLFSLAGREAPIASSIRRCIVPKNQFPRKRKQRGGKSISFVFSFFLSHARRGGSREGGSGGGRGQLPM